VNRYVHLVAHTRGGFDRVAQWASGSWLWEHLRGSFPVVLAACLMPDHLHLLVRWWAEVQEALRRVLQHHGRQFGARWDLGPVTPVNTKEIARRVVRYHGLNPLREGLVDDPLAWVFSTLRDGVGAIADPWVSPARLQDCLDWTPSTMHRFVVSDPACGPETRRPIQRLRPGCAVVGLDAVIDACAASLRAAPDDLRRRGHPMRPTFVALARRHGCPTLATLADACGISERNVFRLEARSDPNTVRAAELCLGDPRLRIWSAPPRR
jgi:hypothetical protein